MKRSRLTFRTIFFSLLGLIVVLTVAGAVLSNFALKKLKSTLSESGIKVRSLRVDLITRSVTIYDFEWRNLSKTDSVSSSQNSAADSSSLRVNLSRIRASNIDVISFLRRKEIHIGTLALSNGTLLQNQAIVSSSQSDEDSISKKSLPFKQITIGRLSFENIAVVMRNDSIVEHQATVDMVLHDVGLHEPNRYQDIHAYVLEDFEAIVGDYRMAAKSSMYTLSIKHMAIDSRSKNMSIDSIVLLPKYGKYQFSRRLGKQVDRFILRVPNVTLTGLDLSQIRDSTIVASSLTINRADLYVFRDKRLPFIKHSHTPLPVALIRKLPFGFALDSLLIVDTRIKYEEFPEKGFETGEIVFDHLQASAAHVTNRALYPELKQSVLHVTSRVMQNGVIKVDFTLPYGKAQVYNAKGRISNLRLESLNPMLESLAFIKVESGRLNALDFDFDYDDYASRGSLLINYENLKLAGMTKEKESKENDVKSLVLGLFVRKDKDRGVPIEKRSGKIYYERDQRRAIFNVWVRSLFSGVKSSVMDAPAERKTQTRKERRDSLRDMRKDNREKKKKDRQEQKNEKESEPEDNTILP